MELTYPDVAAILGTLAIVAGSLIKAFAGREKPREVKTEDHSLKKQFHSGDQKEFKDRGVTLTEHRVKIKNLEDDIKELKNELDKVHVKINNIFEKILTWISQ